MPQKVLAGRAAQEDFRSTTTRARVDQVVLAGDPQRTLGLALARSLKKAKVETVVAYETHCLHLPGDDPSRSRLTREGTRVGVLLGRAGIGFPGSVHLERFAAPGRLALTDDLRLTCLGAVGMLTLVAPAAQLADVLLDGWANLRSLRSVQVQLSGKLRPFSCVKDAALELLARGLAETVRRVDRRTGAPVILEFSGPSARLLSVPERAVLCALAPWTGAASAVFVSDERTEGYLRDQRRSKAFRTLQPDPGAPCDEVVTLDLSTVEPLLLDGDGRVRPTRELQGTPVRQAIVGGDSGTALRDLLVVAALLRSKRIPPGLDLLVAPPSRQTLEVLTRCGALADLIATGARILEPDLRLLSQELYPPVADEPSLRTFDALPGLSMTERPLVGSAETLAYAVNTGVIGDPRQLKRPARISLPRSLPTDDVFLLRKEKPRRSEAHKPLPNPPAAARPFEGNLDLTIGTGLPLPGGVPSDGRNLALVLKDLDHVSWAAAHAARLVPALRALISPEMPAALVPCLSGAGVLALSCSEAQFGQLESATSLRLPRLSADSGDVEVAVGKSRMTLSWLAVEEERRWVLSGEIGTAAQRGKLPATT